MIVQSLFLPWHILFLGVRCIEWIVWEGGKVAKKKKERKKEMDKSLKDIYFFLMNRCNWHDMTMGNGLIVGLWWSVEKSCWPFDGKDTPSHLHLNHREVYITNVFY